MDSCPSYNSLRAFFVLVTSLINQETLVDEGFAPDLTDGGFYDYIIVGAGSAGCVLANRLSELENVTVLLLEAGGEEPTASHVPAFMINTFGTRMDWNYTAQRQQRSCGYQPCPFTRGKCLGGSSALNAMMYNRGSPLDYDNWAEKGNDGWSYKDVLPYFKKSENNLDDDIAQDTEHHSRGGPLSVSRFPFQEDSAQLIYKGLQEMGFEIVDFGSQKVVGVTYIQATQANGKRVSTNRAFLSPIRNERKNLKVVTHCRVTKVLIHSDNKTAYGVEYVLENERNIGGKVFARNEVILSSGAFNSPQILMLSGVGPSETLQKLGIHVIKDLKVGLNLQDHYTLPGLLFNLNNTNNCNVEKKLQSDYLDYIKPVRTGMWTGISTAQVTANYQSRLVNESIVFPDLQLYFMPASSCGPGVNSIIYHDSVGYLPFLLRPASRGNVTINTTDPFSPPLIYTNYFAEPEDIDTILESYNVAKELASTETFRKAGILLDTRFQPTREQIEEGSNPFWLHEPPKQFMYSICHPAGTCKMGPHTDTDAVVDPELQVHGIRNLRVVDASIMPIIISGNLNAAVIMIAEKAADLIKKSRT